MERELQVQAVVTGLYNFGEINRGVNLFSPQLGLINATIFGGRKGRKTSIAPLFSFGTVQLYFNPVNSQYSLTEEEPSFIPEKLNSDISSIYTASYFCELLNTVSTDNPEEFYNLTTDALIRLEQEPELHRKVLIDFTWKFLQLNGLGADMHYCPGCDKELAENEVLFFSTSMITPVCKSCADTDKIMLTPGARRYLKHTEQMTFKEASNVQLLEGATDRLTNIMLSWITVFSQKPLKTVKSGLL